jgi:hypothetical protein
MIVMIDPALCSRRGVPKSQNLAHGRAVDAQRMHDAEVRLHQDANGVGGALDGDPARAGADAGLEVARDEAGARANGALGDLAARRLLDRLVDMLGADVAADGVVQPGIVALADERDDDVVLAADLRPLLRHPLDGGVGHLADGHRVRQQDRRLEQSPLLHLRQPGHFAGTVQDEAARQHAVLEDVLARHDGGHAGADRALADVERTLADDQRGVSDAYAGDVGDRVGGSHREPPDGKPQVAEARSHSVCEDDASSLGFVAGAGVLSALAPALPFVDPVPLPPPFPAAF